MRKNYPWHYLATAIAFVAIAIVFLPVVVVRGVWCAVLVSWEALD